MSYNCDLCDWAGFSNHMWLMHLTAAEHQIAVQQSLGNGELQLRHPDHRQKVVIAKGIRNSTPLINIAEHLSQWGTVVNFIHRTTQVNLEETTIECAVIYENVDSVVDAVKEENKWINYEKADVRRLIDIDLGIDTTRLPTTRNMDVDTDSDSDSDSDDATPAPPAPIPRPATPDSGWELDTEASDTESSLSSDLLGIRKGHVRMNQQLWKCFETAIAGLEGSEKIFEVDVRWKFQTLWLQFIVEFVKKFFKYCLLNIESKSITDERDAASKKFWEDIQETAKSINRKNLTLRQRFDMLNLKTDMGRLEYRCTTGSDSTTGHGHSMAGFLYGKKFWKKSYLQAVTLPMWTVISDKKIRNSKGKQLIQPHELMKPKSLSFFKQMEFTARLEINLDFREDDIPPNGNIGASVNLTLNDETYNSKNRSWRQRKLRFIVSLFESLCSKYLNFRIKQWISSSEGFNYEEFDKKFKKDVKKSKGHPKWRKFRMKRKHDLAEREKYRIKIKTEPPQTKAKTIQQHNNDNKDEVPTTSKKIKKSNTPTVDNNIPPPLKIKKKRQKNSANREKYQEVFQQLVAEDVVSSLLKDMVEHIAECEQMRVEVENDLGKRRRKEEAKKKRRREREEAALEEDLQNVMGELLDNVETDEQAVADYDLRKKRKKAKKKKRKEREAEKEVLTEEEQNLMGELLENVVVVEVSNQHVNNQMEVVDGHHDQEIVHDSNSNEGNKKQTKEQEQNFKEVLGEDLHMTNGNGTLDDIRMKEQLLNHEVENSQDPPQENVETEINGVHPFNEERPLDIQNGFVAVNLDDNENPLDKLFSSCDEDNEQDNKPNGDVEVAEIVNGNGLHFEDISTSMIFEVTKESPKDIQQAN